MGLDSYLNARRYVSSAKWASDNGKTYAKLRSLAGVKAEDVPVPYPHGTITINVAYWRKANAIHKWFVDNVQEGKDDCKPYYVSREQLGVLLGLCQDILKGVRGSEDLPTQNGFFFGDTDYGECYKADLESTVKQLTAILTCPAFLKDWDFEYQASW
jgi:hypothetical protein